MKCKWIDIPFDKYIEFVEDGWPIAQANYGDGEWDAIVHGSGKINSDGVAMTREVGNFLYDSLRSGRITYYGTNCGRKLDDEVHDFIQTNHLTHIPWVYKETICAANCNGYIAPLFNALNKKKVMLVGGPHLEKLYIINVDRFVEIHPTDACSRTSEIFDDVMDEINGIDVICFCAGFATNIVMSQIPIVQNVTMLDMGAIFDPYVGVYSRKRYKTEEWQNNQMIKNIEGTIK